MIYRSRGQPTFKRNSLKLVIYKSTDEEHLLFTSFISLILNKMNYAFEEINYLNSCQLLRQSIP